MLIVICLISILILGLLIYHVISTIEISKVKTKLMQMKPYMKLSEYMSISLKKELVPNASKKINPFIIVIIMFFLFSFSYRL